jgi:NodT family efflux transporter outer membrane factor (OMF) lipoprotein
LNRRSAAKLGTLGLGLALHLAGCAVGPAYRTPKPDTPAQFSARVTQPAQPAPDLASWWRSLQDSELDSLVERAVKSNPDVQIALTRLQQARTYEAVVLGHAVPEIDASAAAGRGTGTDLTRGRAQQPLVSANNSGGLQHINIIAGFDTVWELDIFGKYRREFEAAQYDAQAAAAARDGVLTSVIADVVRAYLDLRGYQTQSGVLRQAGEVLRESLRIVKIRYQRGIVNELDVELATRELALIEAQIAPVGAQANAAQNTLAVLVGEYPEAIAQELAKPELIPGMPAPVSAGLPLDLLRRRPDIRQAERDLAASTARIGVATANLYPQVSLVAAIGAQAQGWGTLPALGKHIWSFGPGAMWPLLDFGALDAQVDIAHLEAHAKLVAYRSTIINAVREVDTSLQSYSAQQARLQGLSEALLAAQRAVDLATQRYDRGLTDFLNVVDAERELYDIQGQYVAGQISAGEQFAQLYKSLGGGWEDYQDTPPIRRPQPAIIAAFRRALSSSSP